MMLPPCCGGKVCVLEAKKNFNSKTFFCLTYAKIASVCNNVSPVTNLDIICVRSNVKSNNVSQFSQDL